MKNGGITLAQKRQKDTNRVAAVFLAPVIILLVIFIFYPIVETFRVSAFEWNGISSDLKFIGLGNWEKLMKDDKFWTAFLNNIKVMILSILIQIPLGIAMATFVEFAGKKAAIFKIIWFIPMLMSSVAIGFLFTYALATNGGIISSISQLLGGNNIDLLGNPDTALYTVIGVVAWQFTPFYMVYCVAGYTNVSEDVYEASIIDGANKRQYFVHIALPLLKPTLKSAAVLSMVAP